MIKKAAIFCSAIFLISCSLAIAETNVIENITLDTTWGKFGSPYIIGNDIQVYPGARLTIEPGVVITIKKDASLIVGGELYAVGESDDLITFTSDQKTPQNEGTWRGIVFLESAVSADYTPPHRPQFIYDYDNKQLLLSYESGSILDYCVIEYFEFGLKSINTLPAIMHTTIRHCGVGVNVEYSPDIPYRKWFYFYANTVEDCTSGLRIGAHGAGPGGGELSHSLISGNTFKNNGRSVGRAVAIAVDGGYNCTLFFNNQIFGNLGIGISDFYTTYYNKGGLFFLGDNVISHNYQGLRLGGAVAMLQNLITENKGSIQPSILGGGVYLAGPYGVIMNNSIQLNGVPDGGHGDGIALLSDENNSFVIRHNNLGNSVWDMYDIDLLGTRIDGEGYNGIGLDCESAAKLQVDAAYNSWMTNTPSDHIYDFEDDMCAGTVNYQPVANSAMIPAPMESSPILISPAHNSYLTKTTTITFNWQPVNGATKYMIMTFGEEASPGGRERHNRVKVINTTTTQILFPTAFNYGMNYFHWFVVAGNDNGWGLPSEIRKVTFSKESILVSGKTIDENSNPVAGVFIGNITFYQTFSDENGLYSLIPPTVYNVGELTSKIWKLQKKDYVTSYTYARKQLEFDVASDLTIISEEKRDAILQAVNIPYDKTKGLIVGVLINEDDLAIKGAKVILEPASGQIIYLDDSRNPDLLATSTGISGEFAIVNVLPGEYTLSADYAKLDFDTRIEVYEDSISVDALIGKMSGNNNGSGDDGSDGSTEESSGGGGGSGCFAGALTYK